MLDLYGSIEISFDTGQGRLVADGRRLIFEVEEPTELHGLMGRRSLRTLADHLHRAGITLQVRSGDRVLLQAGHDAKEGAWSRLLRLPHVQLSPRLAVRSLLAR